MLFQETVLVIDDYLPCDMASYSYLQFCYWCCSDMSVMQSVMIKYGKLLL